MHTSVVKGLLCQGRTKKSAESTGSLKEVRQRMDGLLCSSNRKPANSNSGVSLRVQ
jgi:hypothetical protein